MPLDPNWMHRIGGCEPENIEDLIGLLAASWRREHWLYREAELDDLWRWSEMEMWAASLKDPKSDLVGAFMHVHQAALAAHNHAAYGRLQDAITVLQGAKDQLRTVRSSSDGGGADLSE